MKFIDWFAGVGGFRLALESAGHKCVWSCEIDAKARAVYAARFGHEPEAGDISAINPEQIPDADIWVGGFPCQDVSVAGRREGTGGVRSGLVYNLFELARIKKPKFILLENVPGLFSSEGTDASLLGEWELDDGTNVASGFGEVLRALAELWPAVGWRVFDARYFGVAQRRRRVFLVGGPGEASVKEILFESERGGGNFAKGRKKRTSPAGELARCVGGVSGGNDIGAGKGTIVQQAVSCKWAKGSSGPAGDEHHNLVVAAPITAGGGGGRRKEDDQNLVMFHENKGGSLTEINKANALRAGASHNYQGMLQDMTVRRLSPSETERLQGFPDGHTCLCGVRPECPDHCIPPWIDPKTVKLEGCGHSACGCKCPDGPRYKQMGNAIAVPVVRWLANRFGQHDE